jgi:phage/plasmid-like protein (TIGR03299 family)
MSHELFGERFISLREPAWHRLGIVHQDEIDARESLKRIGGQPKITLEPLYTEVDGLKVAIPNRTILRHPTPDDNEYVPFGIVGPRYVVLTLEDVANIWDAVVRKPIETMGMLQRGANAFMTSKMSAIDINGDEVQRYVLLTTPLDGLRVASVEETDVRVVCQNTLCAAQAQAISRCAIVHDGEAKSRIAVWLKDAYERAELNVSVVKEAFEILSSKDVSVNNANKILSHVYPTVTVREDFTIKKENMERRHELAEAQNRRAVKYRDAVLHLFEGAGTGMNTRAAKNKLWGLYNAVVELEDYRKGTNRKDRTEAVQSAEQAMFGTRAAVKDRAFVTCNAVANDEFEALNALL